MNNFKKIGLSALAGSLVAVSANALEMSVSGGASLTISDQGNAVEGNTWTMGDGLTFSASGETDGGITVSTSYTLDGAGGIDAFSLKMGTDSMGTVTFTGDDGSSALGAVDDVTPNAYEEAWHGAANSATSGTGTVINGLGGDNMFSYTSPTAAGFTFTASYLPSSAAGTQVSSTAIAVAYSPEMVEGLTVGYATGEYDKSATTLGLDHSTMFATYAYGSLTVGYQQSDIDGPTAAASDESTSWAVSYAVSDDFSVSYGQHEYEQGTDTDTQESSGFSASYTMGGTSIKAAFNSTDNIRAKASNDEDSFEIAISFAF